MNLKAGYKTIKAAVAIESTRPTRGGMVEALEIVAEQPLSETELQALTKHPIEADDGRTFSGYAALSSVSYLLYRPNDEVERQRELDRQAAALREMAALLPDEIAAQHPEYYPGMRFDGQEIRKGARINWNGRLMRAAAPLIDAADQTPAERPELWEEINASESK